LGQQDFSSSADSKGARKERQGKMKEYVIKTPSKFLCALSIFAVKLKKCSYKIEVIVV